MLDQTRPVSLRVLRPVHVRRGTTFSQLPLNWPIIEAGYM